MTANARLSRRHMGFRWLGIEYGVLAILVTIAWVNEPTSLERLGLMCACWTPYALGAALWLRGRLQAHQSADSGR